jgi:hypothetical protein
MAIEQYDIKMEFWCLQELLFLNQNEWQSSMASQILQGQVFCTTNMYTKL